jgi:hypothetical protein
MHQQPFHTIHMGPDFQTADTCKEIGAGQRQHTFKKPSWDTEYFPLIFSKFLSELGIVAFIRS